MKSKKSAQIAIAALEDMKGQFIRCINVEKLTAITDYMIVVTGTSSTHIRALADTVVVKLKAANQKITGVEGKMQSEWVLVDAGGVVVHVMTAPVRALYNLEDLWDFKGQKSAEQEADSELMHAVVAEKKNWKDKKKIFRKRSTGSRSNSKAANQSASDNVASHKPGARKPAAKNAAAEKPAPKKAARRKISTGAGKKTTK